MACSSEKNRTDPAKKFRKHYIATKKQQLMSNYRFILIGSRAPVSWCSERSLNDRRLCKSVFNTFPLLDAVQEVVATLFDERRVVSSSYHAVPHGRSVEIERVRNLKFKMFDELGKEMNYSNLPFGRLECSNN
jgi:hypothetical protein